MVNGKGASNKGCRLCGFHTESQLHLLSCPKLSPIQEFVSSLFINAMGTDTSEIHAELTWLLGITNKGALLPSTHLATLRSYWKHVYAAMVRVKYDEDKFSLNLVKQNIARALYSRILAYKQEHLLRHA
eukprot:2400934-Pleurochrysis_carterae.AAC.1